MIFMVKKIFKILRNNLTILNPIVNVNLNNGELTTSVYIKATDRHQYLHYGSSQMMNQDEHILVTILNLKLLEMNLKNGKFK